MILAPLFIQAFTNKSSAPALTKCLSVSILLHMVSSGTGASSTSGELSGDMRHFHPTISNFID